MELLTSATVLPPALLDQPPPVHGRPADIRTWFDGAVIAAIPAHDGTLETARAAAQAYAKHAKADNTRRAYRAGVRAWCDWCHRHALPCLPAEPEDVVAFLAAERGRGLSVTTVELRRAGIRYLHFIAGCSVPTAQAQVAETVSGMRRHAASQGELPAKKLAATADLLRDILTVIPDDLPGLRDRALLLLGFAGALRRAELAAVQIKHLEARERGLRLTLPHSKGERAGRAVTVAIPFGRTELCPVRAIRRWQEAAGITEGALFRRIWLPPSAGTGPLPAPAVGTVAIDPGTVARIIKKRATAAGFDGELFGGHSLKRGALTTGMDGGVHPTRLKQLGRHKSYAVLDEYLQFGDPFDAHPLAGVL
ncbi:MAG: recombinase [Alphaproteobacteria bacterium]|nr:MAG: recombinase [Alphaproteobacteria bacterium]